jgi:hypothetical protein
MMALRDVVKNLEGNYHLFLSDVLNIGAAFLKTKNENLFRVTVLGFKTT